MPTSRSGLHAPTRARALPLFARPFVVLPALTLLPLAAAAQVTSGQLDPIIVTGTREPQPLKRSTADVTLISAETLRNTSADSVEDLLRREAGLQLGRNGGPGQTSGYFLRGANTSGTVVLIDGVRVGSATLGQAELEALTLTQIDHIEVLRGPASSLYGADAVGGVVQIFTRRGEGSPRLTGGVSIGGHRSAQGDLGVSGAQGGFDYAAAIGRERSRGVSALRPGDRYGYYNPDDDGYSRNFGNLRLGYAPAAGHRVGIALVETTLDSQYDSADDLATGTTAAPDFRTFLRTQTASLDYRGEISSLWTTTAQLSHALDDSRSGGTTFSRYETSRDQATWQNALHLADGQQLVLAYEHLREQVQATGFPGEPQRDNNAFVAGYSGQFGVQNLEASLRHDRNSVYGGNTTGTLGYAFAVTPALRLRALAGTTFRAPTFNDLYYPGYGVATIKPERGRSLELGVEWQRGTASASATVYRNRIADLIGYDATVGHCPPDPAYQFGCANNISRARLEGATLTAAERWGGLAVRATVDFLDAKNPDTGVRLARRAAHQETLAADHATGPWTVGGSVVDIGSRPDGGVVLGGYALVNLRAGWRFLPQWRLEAKLLNALGHRDEPTRDYQGLGRQAWIGVRYEGAGL